MIHRYCYEPCPANLLNLYDYVETAGGDMVRFIHANLEKIQYRTDKLWLPDQGTDKGQQPGGKSQYNNPHHNSSSDVPYGRNLGKESSVFSGLGSDNELSRLVAGFTARAHLSADLRARALPNSKNEASTVPDKLEGDNQVAPEADELIDLVSVTHLPDVRGVPLSTTIIMALAAVVMGIAFQNQRSWAQMTSARYSRLEYSQLM